MQLGTPVQPCSTTNGRFSTPFGRPDRRPVVQIVQKGDLGLEPAENNVANVG